MYRLSNTFYLCQFCSNLWTWRNGYEDNEKTIHLLKPLNAYGESKQIFDLWVLEQKNNPFIGVD